MMRFHTSFNKTIYIHIDRIELDLPAAMFSPMNQKQLSASFMSFCGKEENQPLVDLAHREDFQQKLDQKEQSAMNTVKDLLLDAGSETIRVFKPFLKHRVFANLIMSMSNDREEGESGSSALTRWASNSHMIDLLKAAKSKIENRDMEEEQLEHLLISHLRNQGQIKTTRSTLPSSSLASALNETVAERSKAERYMSEGRLDKAVEKLTRALSIVESVQGSNADSESEIASTRVELLIDLGVLKTRLQEAGSAVIFFDRALSEDPGNGRARVEKARCLALAHDFHKASIELKSLEASPHHEDDIDEILDLIDRLKIADKKRAKELAQKMFKS